MEGGGWRGPLNQVNAALDWLEQLTSSLKLNWTGLSWPIWSKDWLEPDKSTAPAKLSVVSDFEPGFTDPDRSTPHFQSHQMNRAGLAYPSGPKDWLEQLASSHRPGTG